MKIEKFDENVKANAMNNFHKFVHGELKAISKVDMAVSMKQIIDSMNEDQQYVLYFLINEALNNKDDFPSEVIT